MEAGPTIRARRVEGREAKHAVTENKLVVSTSPGWVPRAPVAVPKSTGCSRVAAAMLLPQAPSPSMNVVPIRTFTPNS
jgi:hypothetical protein